MPMTSAQSTQIQVLHDYLIVQYERIDVIGVTRLLYNIKIVFSVHSTTAQLAESFRNQILDHWGRGTLTRLQLFLYAFPLLYESCIDLRRARRRMLHIIRQPCMSEVLIQRRHRA